MQGSLAKPRPDVSGSKSTANGCKPSVLLVQDLRPPRTGEHFTFAPVSRELPDTVIEERQTEDGIRSLTITVTIPPTARDTSKDTNVFVKQRILDNVALSFANALATKFSPQLNSLAHPSCSQVQRFAVAHAAACIARSVIQRQLEFDTMTADVDDRQRPDLCESTQSVSRTAYSQPPSLVVKAE